MNPMINKNFPAQKKSIFEKNEDWKKKCMDSAINLTLFNYDSRLLTGCDILSNNDGIVIFLATDIDFLEYE